MNRGNETKAELELKLELVGDSFINEISRKIADIDIDLDKIAQTKAISALGEIRECLANEELSDFDTVEQIVMIFEKYNLSCGGRHDFS